MASKHPIANLGASIAILIFSMSREVIALSTSLVILPLYIYPSDSSSWATLTTSLSANPSLEVFAVVNPSNGPGPGPYPNSDYTSAIASLNTHPNLQTICYVHTSVATRPIAEVHADIDVCAGWAKYTGGDIHMGGIFFDEAPYEFSAQAAAYMLEVSTYARLSLGLGRNVIVFNPGHSVNGHIIDPVYFAMADFINVFEDDYSAYLPTSLSTVPLTQRSKSSVMIHGFTGSANTQTSIIKKLKSGGVGGIFISTQPDYDAWSNLWVQFCKAMSG